MASPHCCDCNMGSGLTPDTPAMTLCGGVVCRIDVNSIPCVFTLDTLGIVANRYSNGYLVLLANRVFTVSSTPFICWQCARRPVGALQRSFRAIQQNLFSWSFAHFGGGYTAIRGVIVSIYYWLCTLNRDYLKGRSVSVFRSGSCRLVLFMYLPEALWNVPIRQDQEYLTDYHLNYLTV